MKSSHLVQKLLAADPQNSNKAISFICVKKEEQQPNNIFHDSKGLC
jgi:hypothetical protein